MTIAFVPMKNFFELKGNSTKGIILEGIEAKLLETISKYMNINFKLVSPEDRQWGYQKPGGNWTGIIGMVARSEADMGLAYLSITESRTRVVDFSIPYSVLDRTFATEKPEPLSTLSNFTYPFSSGVWLSSLFVFMVTVFLFKFLMEKKRPWLWILIEVFGSMCGQNMRDDKRSWKWRLFLGFWLIYVTFLTLAYSVVLLSVITVPWSDNGIKNLEDLSEAVHNKGYRCLAAKGSADTEFLLTSQMNYVNTIGEAIIKNNWFYDPTKGLPKHLDTKTAIIGSRMRMHIAYGIPPYSLKHMSQSSFGVSHVGIALKKGFCCTEALNSVLLRILSSGIYQKYVEHEVYHEIQRSSKENDELAQDFSLSLQELWGEFILLFCGYFTSFLVFLYECRK
ncbi:hypothetical protein JTE90_012958 [Oedothorax gibbosus]|uniref:Ionotropic glutamate receptor L-glutamate and glycine-binding domain-containing protein n=1 Tax=Oedothorax gibbosus TaxID=931172 RepID=A0AAV6TWM2_9ARAC|nr:hypothetical protein JTE90_012958 [Oedothorax gibbosus]